MKGTQVSTSCFCKMYKNTVEKVAFSVGCDFWGLFVVFVKSGAGRIFSSDSEQSFDDTENIVSLYLCVV